MPSEVLHLHTGHKFRLLAVINRVLIRQVQSMLLPLHYVVP